MTTLNDNQILAIIVGGFVSTLFIRVLTFLIKSRCRQIKCCCIECERDVINQANLNNTIIRDIEMPETARV
tara:strand:+ start:624 stop:836 length:213 start_codon:yes stop_codon:yes gene_type:complete